MLRISIVGFQFCYFSFLYFSTHLNVLGKDWNRILVFPGTVEPRVTHIFEGGSLTAYCGSSVKVNWTRSIQGAISNRHSVGHRKIRLNNLWKNDTGSYYCHGIYENNRFLGVFFVYAYNNPKIKRILPSWIEVSNGTSVALTCGSLGVVEWFGLHIHMIHKTIVCNVIILHNLQEIHSGIYLCRGIDTKWKIFHTSALVIVEGYAFVGHRDNELNRIRGRIRW